MTGIPNNSGQETDTTKKLSNEKVTELDSKNEQIPEEISLKSTPEKMHATPRSEPGIDYKGKLFLIHLCAGFGLFLASIFLPRSMYGFGLFLTLVFPIAIMFSYYFLAKGQYRKGNALNLADSMYYLGFIFTLCALLVSFLAPNFRNFIGFDIGKDAFLRSEELLSAFGMALVTTLVGLIFRTVIVQSQNDPLDQINEFEIDLREYGQEATEQMQTVVNFFKEKSLELRESFSEENRKFIAEINAQTGQVHKGLTEEYLKVYQNLSNELNEVSSQASGLTHEQTEYRKDITKLRKKIAGMEGNLSDNIANAFVGLDVIKSELETRVGEIASAAASGAEAINRSVEPLTKSSSSIAKTAQDMSKAADGILHAAKKTGELERNVLALGQTFSQADRHLQASLSSLESKSVELSRELSNDSDKAFSELSAIIDRFATSIAAAKKLL